jgi:hypothetical protein
MSDQREKIYSALCMTLSERIDQVDWDSFLEADWSQFSDIAVVEGVAPLIHWTFEHEDISGIDIPTQVKAKLLAAYYNTTAQNQVMFRELTGITDIFNEANVPVIILKGAALAFFEYPDIGLRPMGDIDLLVKKENLTSAVNCLELIGYTSAPPRSRALGQEININIEFLKHEKSPWINLELHWRLIAGKALWYSPDMDWFWKNSRRLSQSTAMNTIISQITHIFSPLAQLLYLSAHLMLQHAGTGYRHLWLYDMYLIIQNHRDEIDWQELSRKAIDYNWQTALLMALEQLDQRFNVHIPPPILKFLIQNKDQRTERLIRFKSHPRLFSIIGNWYKFLALQWKQKILFIYSKFFPSQDYLKWRYQNNKSMPGPFLYFHHWGKTIINILS